MTHKFSIDSILGHLMNTKPDKMCTDIDHKKPNSPGCLPSGSSDVQSILSHLVQDPKISAVPELPSLSDWQILLGNGRELFLLLLLLFLLLILVPKSHYRRLRRNGIDRKPRQAYSTNQLGKLEDEFKVRS